MDREKLLNKFETYVLVKLGLITKTFRAYNNRVINYLDWLEAHEIKPKKVTLDQTYSFIAHRREKGDSDRNIKGFKSAITHFNQAIKMKSNPALMLHLAKSERKTPTKLLEVEFLDSIYREAKANTLVQKRDRCILGVIIFQGLGRTELELLQLEDLDIENARLYLSETITTNERYIPLNTKQILYLSNYIYDIRPSLLKYFNKQTNQLFFSSGEGNNLNGALSRLLRSLKTECHYLKDFKQLKQSRMAIWVKEFGLREAQYLGGYRYVTSVQRYDFKNLDELHKLLEFHHPMEKMA